MFFLIPILHEPPMHPAHESAAEHAVDGDFESLDYSYAQNVTSQNTLSWGERELWCAVIEQAFVDIGAIAPVYSGHAVSSPTPRKGRDQDEAARWLLRDNKDFTRVCLLAGVSAMLVRRAAEAFYTLHRDTPR